MIKQMKINFIFLAMASLFGLLLIIIVGMNVINYNSVIIEADKTLEFLSQNNGAFPMSGNDNARKLPSHMSPEAPYETRYFSVLLDNMGNVILTETSQIFSVNASEAEQYAKAVLSFSKKSGFLSAYRYMCSTDGNTTRITFLDCGRKLDFFMRFLWISIGMGIAGLIIIFLIISFFADRIIRPIAESYEKQKRFITDAGHEIKTPLTIINANVDLLEMNMENNECLSDIRQQAERLTTLTNDLIYLSRMEEEKDVLLKIELPVSDIVFETVTPFKALAQTQNKEFTYNIQPMLSIIGNPKAIQQLTSLLMDNALKYSPDGGIVSVTLIKQNKYLNLTVYNTTEEPIENANLSQVFERFYRTDRSRNSETGGHGIGLSVARAIVNAHGGKINAWTQDGHSFNITVLLPL